jgi:hypothetical protein
MNPFSQERGFFIGRVLSIEGEREYLYNENTRSAFS